MSCILTFCFFTLVCHSMGKTTENPSLSDDKETIVSVSLSNDSQKTDDNNSTSPTKMAEESGRSEHFRMLPIQDNFTTTTTDKPTTYNYWSFFTTPRRPFISYRDYPGKPGVATWKEISSTAVKDRKDRKVEDPTAASVSSNSHRWRAWLSAILLYPVFVQMVIFL